MSGFICKHGVNSIDRECPECAKESGDIFRAALAPVAAPAAPLPNSPLERTARAVADAYGREVETLEGLARSLSKLAAAPLSTEPDIEKLLQDFGMAAQAYGAKPDVSGRHQVFRDYSESRAALLSSIRSLTEERDEMRGGSVEGPWKHCRDCGERMVWDSSTRDCPVWMCPRHTRMRADEATAEVSRLTSELEAATGRHETLLAWYNDLEARLAAAKQDTERLDFISNPQHRLGYKYGLWWTEAEPWCVSARGTSFSGATFREAIDAALTPSNTPDNGGTP